MGKLIAYYRVSRLEQSGFSLDLQNQKLAVKEIIGRKKLHAEFYEIESGRQDRWIELQKAIQSAKSNNATLIIAKMDGLTRNVGFLSILHDSKVELISVDIPELLRETLGILLLLAKREHDSLSSKIRQALQTRKADGYTLGTPENLTEEARERSIEVRRDNADNSYENRKAFKVIVSLRAQKMSYARIALHLNDQGFKPRRGKEFYATSVKNIFERFSKL